MKKILFSTFLLLVVLNISSLAQENKYLSKAEKSLLNEKWENLIQITETWIKEERENPIPYYFLQYAYYATSYIDEANEMNSKIVLMDKNSEKFYPVAEEILKRNPDNPHANIMMEYAHYYRKEYDKAKKVLEKAMELKSDYGPAYFELAMIYDYTGNEEKSLRTIEKGLEMAPDFLGNYLYAGIYYKKQKDYENREKIYKEAIEKDKKSKRTAYFHNELALTYFISNEYDKALEILDEGLKIKPNSFGLKILLGDVYFKDNQISKAKAVYEKLHKSLPEDRIYQKDMVKSKLKKVERKLKREERK